MNPEWHDNAACKPHPQTWWFPEHGDGTYNKARPICHTCPVRAQCLAHALNQPEKFGMWGGYDTKERQGMLLPPHTIGRRREPIPHGTYGGHRTHLRRGETPCDECRKAHNTYWREYKRQRRAVLRVIDGEGAA